MRRKVYISAYLFENFGDDLFVKVLCERYPDHQFIIFASKIYKEIFSTMTNLKVVNKDNLLVKIKRFAHMVIFKNGYRHRIQKKCDICIRIGGSLFIQNENWKEEFKEVSYEKKIDQPYHLIGSNFGPYQDQNYKDSYLKLFRDYEDICFRDKKTFSLFNSLPNVRYAPDIALTLHDGDNFDKDEKGILISVLNLKNRDNLKEYNDNYMKNINLFISYYLEKGYNVTLLSLCKLEGDEEVVDFLYNQHASPNNCLFKKAYNGDLEEIIALFKSNSIVLGTRFHSMILGWRFNCKVIPLIYNEKMLNVIADFNFNGPYYEINKYQTIDFSIIDNYMKETTSFLDITEQIKEAQKQFMKLDMKLQRNLYE